MAQRPSGPAGAGSGDWPDDLWPDDDPPGGHGGDAEGAAADGPSAAPPTPPGWPGDRPPGRRFRPALLLVIALLAAAAGAGIVLAVDGLSGSSSATPGPASQPISQPTIQPGGGALPGTGPGGTGGTLFVIGKVTAVSSGSITIGGAAHAVTAAVTGSTRVTGNVSSIGAVKVGDQVSAQIVQNGGSATATAIQDPARSPVGGSAP